MKLLVDTSVWSLALRRKRAASLNPTEQRLVALLADAIHEGQVMMLGPIRQELLSGIKEKTHFEELRKSLRDYRDEPLDSHDHEEAARFYNLCRSRGVECGPIDILLCSVAIRRGWQLISHDRGLDRCMEILDPGRRSLHKRQ